MRELRNTALYTVTLSDQSQAVLNEEQMSNRAPRMLKRFKRREYGSWWQEREEKVENECNTLKDKNDGERKNRRVCGMCTITSNCGVFIGIGEVYKSETREQVTYTFYRLLDAIFGIEDQEKRKHVLDQLTHIFYDDACHLKPFVDKVSKSLKEEVKALEDECEKVVESLQTENADQTQQSHNESDLVQHLANKSSASAIMTYLSERTFKIDRMHHENHKRTECKSKNGQYNPYNDPNKVLDGINTQVCEQTNTYISGRKHMFNQMDEKAMGMWLRMLQRRNQRLCE